MRLLPDAKKRHGPAYDLIQDEMAETQAPKSSESLNRVHIACHCLATVLPRDECKDLPQAVGEFDD